MGSSDQETGVVDCSVGSIVWVRRRNGSWWPGKILGSDELSAAHLMSPRSGTPVKLLGREDASVDWYNLEKSKRVKAFRCGEFDDCIERAESSQGMPPKKREKYARREDAILHALELEKELLEKKYGKLGCSSNGKSGKSSDSGKEEFGTSSECLDESIKKYARPKSHQVSKKPELSPEGKKTTGRPFNGEKAKEGNQLSGDDDNSIALPRMRGLQDFGLRIAPSTRKLFSSIASNGSQKTDFENNAHAPPCGDLITGNTVQGSLENSFDKTKRSNDGLKRDRRRPLIQLLQRSTELPVDLSLHPYSSTVSMSMSEEDQTGAISRAKRSRFISLPGESGDCLEDREPNQMELSPPRFEESNSPHHADLSEGDTSGSMEDTETDSSDTDSLDSDTDEQMMLLSDDVVPTELEPKFVRRSEAALPGYRSMRSDAHNDLELTGDMSHLSPEDPVFSGVGVSKWQLKGKRKNRSLTKRSAKGTMYGTNLEDEGSYGCDEVDNRRYQLKPTSRVPQNFSDKITDWEDSAWNDQSNLKGYWEEPASFLDPVFVGRRHFGGKRKSMLVEVDLKVQSGYQREHVPMISLMSKLNGQAIVGHPVQIEALEDGSSETLLSAAENFCTEMLENDTALPPVWRTARRTANFRVPRPHPSTTLDGDENPEHFNKDRKVLLNKSRSGSSSQRGITVRKGLSHVVRPPTDRKLTRKPPKKISLSSSSSQKIRTLSSIATVRKPTNDPQRGGNSYQVDGLIKPESGPTAVACIPVKLVFSRLYEELVGRHQ